MNNENFKRIFYENSKTFSLASKFFDERLFINISKLYYVCRCIDDIADNVKETINPEQELTNLQIDFDKNNIDNDIVSIFYSIENKVNKKHILKLIDGVKSDIKFTPYETIDQLLNYCHKVAGVVGIMFCEILGIDDNNALIKANDLGIAMQLTNIMRDIFEDANMGRVYLPHELFGRINPYDINIKNKDVVDKIYSEKIDQIYNIAETKYLSGISGLKFLNYNHKFIVYISAIMYREIGNKIIKNKEFYSSGKRSYVSLIKKIELIVKCFFQIFLWKKKILK